MCNCYLQKSCIKDANHKLVWANDEFLSCIGIKSLDQAVSLTDYDLPWQEYADIYKQHELDTLLNNCYSTFQPVKDGKGNNFVGVITKNLKLDEEGNKFIHTNFNELSNINIIDSINTLIKIDQHNKFSSYSTKKIPVNLSPRESECLFYLAHGKSCKAIAKILNLSPRTVEQYIEKIKSKFNCFSKGEIIEAAIQYGFVNVIPSSLLTNSHRFRLSLDE